VETAIDIVYRHHNETSRSETSPIIDLKNDDSSTSSDESYSRNKIDG
jgi:hypothetical protein